MIKVPLALQIAEVERDLTLRASEYPSKVKAGLLSHGVSDARIKHLTAALNTLRWFQDNEELVRDAMRMVAETKRDATVSAALEVFPDAKVVGIERANGHG